MYAVYFLLGACFAGRVIIGLTYIIELLNPRLAKLFVMLFFFGEPIILILLTAWYQFVDHAWLTIFIITLVLLTVAIAWFWIFVPESSKWLYTWKRYEEMREVLQKISEFNGVDKD